MIVIKKILTTLFYIFFPTLIGAIVGLAISGHIDYNSLNQPPLAPPRIAFPIAWSIIYLLMGISYYIYKKRGNDNEVTSFIYYLQLFVNALWSIIFFIWKARLFAIIWILFLLALVVLLILQFRKEEKISAYLNLPYLAWLIFATYLNIGIYILNR